MCNSPSGFYWDFKAGKPLRFNGAAALYSRSYVLGGRGEKSGGDSEEAMKERKTGRLVHALWMENVKIEYVSLVAG